MRVIKKYPIQLVDRQEIEMPTASEILHVAMDEKDVPCVWALVMPDAEPVLQEIFAYQTGKPIAAKSLGIHIGSFGKDLWHVFKGKCRVETSATPALGGKISVEREGA